jgi:ACS family tartrate transporter-like MFS transporter
MTGRQALISPRVLALSMVYFAIVFGLYGLGFWIPTIIKKSLTIADNFVVTLLVAAPYVVGLAVTAFGTSLPWLGYAGLSVCAIGVMASFPGFWTLPSAFMSGAAAAVGIAVINAIGNLAGFAGPYWVGWMTDLFGDAKWGLISIGIVMIFGALAVLSLGSAPARPSKGN